MRRIRIACLLAAMIVSCVAFGRDRPQQSWFAGSGGTLARANAVDAATRGSVVGMKYLW